MHFLSEKIVESMQIPDEDKELYEYGVLIVLRKLLFYCVIFCVMLILKQELEGICFLLTFLYLRRNAGGLHCKTFAKCFLLSVGSILMSVLLIKYQVFAVLYYRYAIIFSEAILILIRPVDCENKRVLEEEKQYFYKQEKIILGIINIIVIMLVFCGFSNIEKSVESAVIWVAVTSMIAFLSQKAVWLNNYEKSIIIEPKKSGEGSQEMLIYVCDDNEIHQKNISTILKKYCLGENIPLDIKSFSDGEKLLFGIQEEVKPIDAFFLDIELHEENGMELAKEIKKQYSNCNIVYISSHDKYVFQVFETEPMDYLLKPFNEENVYRVMNRICEKVSCNKTIQLMVARKNVELNVDWILYIESTGRILYIHTKDNLYRTYNKMDEMLDKLSEISASFVRIHRSVIINYDYVKNIRGDDIFLDNGINLVISRKYREPFKKFSMQYIENKVNKM